MDHPTKTTPGIRQRVLFLLIIVYLGLTLFALIFRSRLALAAALGLICIVFMGLWVSGRKDGSLGVRERPIDARVKSPPRKLKLKWTPIAEITIRGGINGPDGKTTTRPGKRPGDHADKPTRATT